MSQTLTSAAQSISPILKRWAKEHAPSPAERKLVIAWETQHIGNVWHQNTDASEAIASRAELLQKVVSSFEKTHTHSHSSLNSSLSPALGWSEWIVPLWTLWLPLAQQLDRKQAELNRPFIQGILGAQGTGKTTLSKMLQIILAQLGHQTVSLSLDDLYLTYAKRQALQKTNQQMSWRGPPGTHDITLGLATLRSLRSADCKSVSIPQFDKSLHSGQGDQTTPIVCPTPTIVLFEGWFVGAQPLAKAFFNEAKLPHPITTIEDYQFAQDCNEQLRQYTPMWNFLDDLMVLCPQDYRWSMQWRRDAEHKMKAEGKAGLSDREITEFVTYFWKALHPDLFIAPLAHSRRTNLVVYIESDHRVGSLRAPASGYPGPV